MVKIMIADDNPAWVTSCSKYLTNEKEISLCSIATDGEETLNYYLANRPDVLLLDLDMPKLSGAEVINKLSSLPEEKKKRNVIIVSGRFEEQIKFRNLEKVYNLIPKPVDYQTLLDNIYEVVKYNNKKELNKIEIRKVFVKLKLNVFSKGAIYLFDLISMCYENENLIDNYKYTCAVLAHKYKISEKNIQWSIENSIKTMCKYVNIEDLNSIFLYHDLKSKKISPKQFIELMLEYINRTNL